MMDIGRWMCVSCVLVRFCRQKIKCPCEVVCMDINKFIKRAVNTDVKQPRICALTFWEHQDLYELGVESHYPFCIFK